jgi:hypothetical protein
LNNGPSAGAVTWTVGLNFLRHVISTETGKVTSVDLNTRTEFTPYFNLGGKILGNDNARVFIGSNNKLPVQIFDGYDGDTDSFSAFATGLIVSPNILGELALTDNFLLFGGATHNWLVFGYGSESYETKATLATPSTTSDVSYLQSKMNTTTATVVCASRRATMQPSSILVMKCSMVPMRFSMVAVPLFPSVDSFISNRE